MLDILIYLDKELDIPLYQQIYNFFKEKIINGEIKASDKLMSIIKLKNHLNVSRNTVETAYQQLLSEGYIYSISGSGYFVNKLDPVICAVSNKSDVKIKTFNSIHTDDSFFTYNFKPGSVDIINFPFNKWRRISNSIMREETDNILTHSHPFGEEGLRKEVAEYLKLSRGVSCSYKQIVIGAGTQYLMRLLCSLLNKESNKSIAFEEPGFSSARKVYEDFNYEIYPIPITKTGVDLTILKNLPRTPSLIYTTPSNQFPYGTIMSIRDRIQILNWVSNKNCYIIEDDFDSEYRYDVNPIPSLHSIDKSDRVIYLGTFSKTLFSSMHVAYVVLPEELMNRLIDNSNYLYQTASKIHQLTIARFIKEGMFESHIRKMRKIYADKQKHLVNCIKEQFNDRVKIYGASTGLNIVLEINSKHNECDLIHRAMKNDVRVYPLSFYYYQKENYSDNSVILGYGSMSKEDIGSAIKRLKDAWFSNM